MVPANDGLDIVRRHPTHLLREIPRYLAGLMILGMTAAQTHACEGNRSDNTND
jgi:hypothetical protein